MKHVGGLLIAMTMLVLSISSGHALAQASSAPRAQTSVMAINILLLPDATMVQHAQAVNARLRGIYPNGFSLDAAHHPHITLFQCFVPTADLERVYAAADKVFARTDVSALKLKAFKSYYFPMESLGLSGIVVEPTPELVQLQRDLIAAVAPYTVKTATSAAFVIAAQDPDIQPVLIHYIEEFATAHAGQHFQPHVTTGVAPRDYLDKLLAEPFDAFTFSPAGAAVYQLGSYGTAAKALKRFAPKP